MIDDTTGNTTPDRALPGEWILGETVPGETVSGETVPGEAVSGEAVPGETVPGGADALNAAAARVAHPSSRQRRDRPTLMAGWSSVAIAVLHTAAFAVHPHWGAWLAGPTRSGTMPDGAITLFWALPGGFVVPLAVLGLLMIDVGRKGQPMPRYVGWILLSWIVTCLWIIGPSGFLLGLVPTVLLLWPSRVRRAPSERLLR